MKKGKVLEKLSSSEEEPGISEPKSKRKDQSSADSTLNLLTKLSKITK